MMSMATFKAGFRRLVKACGGQESCVLIEGIGISRHQHFSEVGQIDRPADWLRIDRVALMEADCGQPIVTELMARATGHVLVKLPEIGAEHGALGRVTGQALRETSEVFAKLGEFMADGTLSRVEGATFGREVDEAVIMLLQLKAQVERESGTGSAA